MKYIIIVSKGHNVFNNGVFDNGSVNPPYYEAKIVDKTVEIFKEYVKKQGHIVHDVTPKNERFKNSYNAHKERANRVNRIYNSLSVKDKRKVIYLDFHTNAGGGTGCEALISGKSAFSEQIGSNILNSIKKNTGLRNRGLKYKPNFWSISMVIPPAIIIEGGFTDNNNDMKVLTPEVYAKSVAEVFGSVKKEDDKLMLEDREYSITGKDYVHKSFNDEGTLYTGLRKLAERLGYDVSNKGNKALINYRQDKAIVNGENVMMENVKTNKDTTLVPLKELERLGLIETDWDNNSKTIIIKSK